MCVAGYEGVEHVYHNTLGAGEEVFSGHDAGVGCGLWEVVGELGIPSSFELQASIPG